MNQPAQQPSVNGASGAALGFATVIVIITVVVFAARFAVSSPAIDADRGAERSKAFADLRAAEDTALSTPVWVDQDRQIVRLPMDVAIQLTVQAWQNPEQARADLIARAVK